MVSYKLTRSRRKTLAIHIRDGLVEVRAPEKLPLSEINKFVASKEKWIKDKLNRFNDLSAKRSSFEITYGDRIVYRGKPYPITARDGVRIGFDDAGFYVPQDLTADRIKSACVQIYRLLAKRDLTIKTLTFARDMCVTPSAIKISDARTRWGSCSGKKSINYSWRLIMAEDSVIDYVIVHELAHLTELNHSDRFWAIVESILPDYVARRAKLKVLQKTLSSENWD